MSTSDPTLTAEFVQFLKAEKKWWLAPLLGTAALLSATLVFAEGSAFAPFIYTLF